MARWPRILPHLPVPCLLRKPFANPDTREHEPCELMFPHALCCVVHVIEWANLCRVDFADDWDICKAMVPGENSIFLPKFSSFPHAAALFPCFKLLGPSVFCVKLARAFFWIEDARMPRNLQVMARITGITG